MDPNTATREQFTKHITSKPIPQNASPQWLSLIADLKALLEKLAYHPAMAPNLQQTYMTPANSKNRVYFLWDFVGRTLGMAHSIPPTLQSLSKQQKEVWNDAMGRSVMTSMLIQDDGKMDQMFETPAGEEKPELGEEILELAKNLGAEVMGPEE